MNRPPQLLYILGTARSGSTILEILLAGGKGVFGAGELTALVEDGFIENKPCSCGKPCRQCEVWGHVLARLDLKPEELETWKALQKRIDWHTGFLRQLFGLVRDREKRRYAEYNRRLLAAIRARTGCTVVVDSSKYAGRALALVRMVQADIKILCLTRAPEGLMASFQKPNKEEQRPKPPFAVLLYYLFVLWSLRVCIGLVGKERVREIRYEELVADPQGVLRDIAEWSGLDLTEPLRRLEKNAFFEVGHLVTGNRLRKRGVVHFEPKVNFDRLSGVRKGLPVFLMNAWRRFFRF